MVKVCRRSGYFKYRITEGEKAQKKFSPIQLCKLLKFTNMRKGEIMSENNNELSKSFKEIINDIKEDVNRTQLEIMLNANFNLVNLYYRIGKIISENSIWGNKFIDNLALELKISFPNIKHFSVRNLKYMKSFYEEYKEDNEIVHLCAQLPWKHNIELIQKVKDKNIRKWYMEKCLQEGWSKNILIYQLDTDLYQRQVKSIKHNNFELTLKQNSDLANQIMKEPYVFDLIELTEDYKEKELENKMIEKLKNVLLELGSGFSFVGNQYKIQVDNQDFYIDLLFYHIKLKCYVAVELKVTEFKPEFGSKMSFYLTALDEQVKDENDNASIGIILCQSKSDKIVDYTLKYINRPVGVSEYKIFNKLPENILKELPKKEDIIIHLEEGEEYYGRK